MEKIKACGYGKIVSVFILLIGVFAFLGQCVNIGIEYYYRYNPSITQFKITSIERQGTKYRLRGTMIKADDRCKFIDPSIYDKSNDNWQILKFSRQKAGKIRVPGPQAWGPLTVYGVPADATSIGIYYNYTCYGLYDKFEDVATIDLTKVEYSPWEP